MRCGSFNFSWRLHWEDWSEDWLIRFPLAGKSMVLDEKVQCEAALMQYIAKNTSIPVPRVVAYGKASENPTGLGPFIIMTWVEGKKMSDVLRKEDTDPKEAILDPGIDQRTLQTLYGQMAEILLELWDLNFEAIGSLALKEQAGTHAIAGRPLTIEMNELIRTCGLKESVFEDRVYHSTTDYIASLLEQQSKHLEQQRNSIYDSMDCREKYACRHLMKAIALNFIDRATNYGPFQLFCDDLCPGNVLVDDTLQVTGVIDWEFSYAAPSQFAGSIPWWLLLQKPHTMIYRDDLATFLEAYHSKAELFLDIMEQKEEARNIPAGADRLSTRMRQSLQDKSAWFMMACRKVSSAHMIYWDLVDEYCWGPRASMAERVHQFTSSIELHQHREEFVRRNIRELEEYNAELGRDDNVEYEEEHYGRQLNAEHERPRASWNSRLLVTGTMEVMCMMVMAGLFVRRVRR